MFRGRSCFCGHELTAGSPVAGQLSFARQTLDEEEIEPLAAKREISGRGHARRVQAALRTLICEMWHNT